MIAWKIHVVMVCLFSSPLKDALSYYCEDYPVTNYTVVVENSFNSSETLSLFLPPNETYISISSLSENTVYTIRILAWNAFGSTSTDNKEICE